MNPKQRPFDPNSIQKDEHDYGEPDKLGGRKAIYDRRTEEKVVVDNPSQRAATSGPTRDEAEAWLRAKGLSKDEVELIIVCVFDFARETTPSVRAVADALGHKGRAWVSKKLREPAVKVSRDIVLGSHVDGIPLPAIASASGLPQPEEIDAYVTRTLGGPVVDNIDASNIMDVAKNPAMLLKMRLQISHYPDDHPQRHRGNNSLIGCAADAREMLKPGGLHRDTTGKFAQLKFPRGRLAQFPPSSQGLSSMFSENEFGKEEARRKRDAGEEHVERIERRLYGRIARSGQLTPRALIEAIEARGIKVPKAPTEIDRLNQLLAGNSLHEEYKTTPLPSEANLLIERGISNLTGDERGRLNRLILDAAFPELCPRNRFLPFLNRKLEPEDIVPIIRMNPSWLLQEEWRLLLEALVDLLEGGFYGDSARRVPGIAATGSRKRVSTTSTHCLSGVVQPQRGNAYNYDTITLSGVLDGFFRRVCDLQAEWRIVRQRPESIFMRGLVQKFQDAHGRELQGYSLKRLKNILTDNPRVVAADLAGEATGLDASVFTRAKAHQAKASGR